MRITIRNNAQLSNKFLNFIKWKLNSMGRKFQDLIYVEVFLNSEGQSPRTFISTLKLGVRGHDIVLQNKSENLGELLQKSTQSVHRYLAKHKTKKRNEIFHKKIS
ncbi:MAG: ribosomal subunit interface protein [Granulosicoccus sp.]|jgi:ribosomal subunit interface protein